MQLERARPELPLEPIAFDEADAVLARDRPAEPQRELEQRLGQLRCERELALVVSGAFPPRCASTTSARPSRQRQSAAISSAVSGAYSASASSPSTSSRSLRTRWASSRDPSASASTANAPAGTSPGNVGPA
ncbi:MAG: hypothetical protein AUG91_01165 [Actinobacteria bacterium 13_1_20CM_4_69_9]|nr:MAG: hypothetical protein AUG91_01165 [Actinobacteria bacterium 13_1_20CM_4_69_9]